MERVIKVHNDVVTVPEAIRLLQDEYRSIGYSVSDVMLNAFYVFLDDGKFMVCWKNGSFYEVFED